VFIVVCGLAQGDAHLAQEAQHFIQAQEIHAPPALHVLDAAAPRIGWTYRTTTGR
jgi:hypothetical protein